MFFKLWLKSIGTPLRTSLVGLDPLDGCMDIMKAASRRAKSDHFRRSTVRLVLIGHCSEMLEELTRMVHYFVQSIQ